MTKKAKIKLPKRVAGVKIPKVVRKGPIGHFLNTGAGQLLMAEAVMAAAAMFTAAKVDDDPAEGMRRPTAKARRAGRAAADLGAEHTERLLHAFKQAGKAFREALQDDPAEWHEVEAEVENKAKKKSSRLYSSTRH